MKMHGLMAEKYEKQKNPTFSETWAGVAGAVGKISAFRPQGPRLDSGFDEIRIFVQSSFPPKLTQLSILPG